MTPTMHPPSYSYSCSYSYSPSFDLSKSRSRIMSQNGGAAVRSKFKVICFP
jgi:hypothetical protein